MKNIFSLRKSLNKIVAISVMAALIFTFITGLTGIEESHAAAPGVYLATATGYYQNPITGVVEDSGGEASMAIGQGMTNSVVYPQALIEVDAAGNTYATVRLKLASNISGVSFATSGGGGFSGASGTITNDNPSGDYRDYRILVPHEASYIRVSMHVLAMGRDVVTFIGLSGLNPGQGDFVSTINTAVPAPTAPATEAKKESTKESKKHSDSKKSDENKDEKEKAQKDSDKKDEKKSESDKAKGENDKDGKEIPVKKSDAKDSKKESDSKALPITLTSVGGLILVGGGYFIYMKKFKK